jgi:signal peptidase I
MGRRRHKYSYTTQKEQRRKTANVLKILLAVFLSFEFISAFLVRNVVVWNTSMKPGIEAGDRLLVTPLVYGPPVHLFGIRFPGIHKPERGDLVLVRPPYLPEQKGIVLVPDSIVRFLTFQNFSLLYRDRNSWENSEIVKRVIALPGDSVYVKDFTVYVKTSDSAHFLTEYEVGKSVYDLNRDGLPANWDPAFPLSGSNDVTTLSDDQYFVVSDNRLASNDSRYWGPISGRNFEGRVFLRYWPFARFSGF